jgi:hypothetical protein
VIAVLDMQARPLSEMVLTMTDSLSEYEILDLVQALSMVGGLLAALDPSGKSAAALISLCAIQEDC